MAQIGFAAVAMIATAAAETTATYGAVATAAIVAAASAAGALVDQALKKPVEGPRLGDVQVSTATEGLPIPRGWGVVRLPGQLLWAADFQEHEETSGGKGMKGGGVTSFRYTCSFAYAFALGPAERILRLWADGKLVYDELGQGDPTVPTAVSMALTPGMAAWHHTLYAGTADQMPDPTIEAAVGVGQVSGYRGLVYIVCRDLDVGAYGNRIPNVSALIAFAGQGGVAATTRKDLIAPADGGVPATGYSAAANGAAYDGVRGVGYLAHDPIVATTGPAYLTWEYALPMAQGRSVSLQDMFAGTAFPYPMDGSTHPIVVATGATDGSLLWLLIGNFTRQQLAAVDPVSTKVVGSWGDWTAGPLLTTASTGTLSAVPTRLTVMRLATPEGIRDAAAVSSQHAGPVFFLGPTMRANQSWAAEGITYLGGARDEGEFVQPYAGAYGHTVVVEGRRELGRTEAWILNYHHAADFGDAVYAQKVVVTEAGATASPAIGLTYDGLGFGPADGSGVELADAQWDRANQLLILQFRSDGVAGGGAAAAYRIMAMAPDGAVAWVREAAAVPVMTDAAMGQSRLLGSSYAFVTGTTTRVIDTRTGAEVTTYGLPTSTTNAGGTIGTPGSYQAYDSITGYLFMNSSADGFQRFLVGGGSGAPVPLSTVVRDICVDCGLADADIDVSELGDDQVRGFITTVEKGRESIDQLAAVYFFDTVEEDDVVAFRKRGRTPVATIPYAKVLRAEPGRPALKPRRAQAIELPRSLTLRFPNWDNSQQQGSQTFGRSRNPVPLRVVESVGAGTADTRVVMTPTEAKTAAMRSLMMAWRERDGFSEAGLTVEHAALSPADVVTLGLADGASWVRARLTKIDLGADWTLRFDAVVEDQRLATAVVEADGGAGTPAQAQAGPYSVVPEVLPLPLLRDGDDAGGAALRVYLAAGANAGQDFGGAAFLMSASPATDYARLGPALPTGAAWGAAENALGDVANPWITDETNTLTVAMQSGGGRLEGATYEQVLNGANGAALAASDGSVEVIQFQAVTPLGNDRYRLSGLFRGRRGTDHATGLHGVGDRFVLLEASALRMAGVDTAALGSTRYLKALGVYDVPDAAPVYPTVFSGAAEKPYSPVNVEGARDGSNNLTLTWLRRSRIGGEWSAGTESVPLGEEAEAYSVDVVSGSTVVRTIAGLTSPTASYPASEQSADGFTPGDPITVRVYQTSALVGRGYPREATV